MINKKNLPLIIALTIPVVMIAAIAISIYAPGIGKQPKQNFLYATGNVNYGSYQYLVRNGQLQQIEIQSPTGYPSPVKTVPLSAANFYIYYVESNTAAPITFEQAQQLHLNSSSTSQDGYTVERGSGGGDFPFGGGSGDYNSWYIKGYNRSHKLNLKLDSSDPGYYNNFQFLGWVE